MRSENGRAAAEIGKSVCLSIVFTLAAVLVFALCIKLFSIGSGVIKPVNQAIKYIAIFLGCFFCIRTDRRILKGAISGLCVTLLTYFIFALIAGAISFGWANVLDFIFGALAGCISCAIVGLIRNKN